MGSNVRRHGLVFDWNVSTSTLFTTTTTPRLLTSLAFQYLLGQMSNDSFYTSESSDVESEEQNRLPQFIDSSSDEAPGPEQSLGGEETPSRREEDVEVNLSVSSMF
jgi:hypothetical protein